MKRPDIPWVRSTITHTINFGAPMYDNWDHRGCYNVYLSTATEIMSYCSKFNAPFTYAIFRILDESVTEAKKRYKYCDKAPYLRFAFDAILDLPNGSPSSIKQIRDMLKIGLIAARRANHAQEPYRAYQILKGIANIVLRENANSHNKEIKRVVYKLRNDLRATLRHSVKKRATLMNNCFASLVGIP